jgi:pyruvate dehydrogenase E2 component (dihydrolipoamide acetyltransferase)
MANAIQVKLPELGDGIDSGDILDIFVSVGDVVEEGQDVVEIETDKATVPIPSSAAGKVVKINVSQGDSVPIGGVILEVESSGGSAQGGGKSGGKQTTEAKSPEPAAKPPQAENKPEPAKSELVKPEAVESEEDEAEPAERQPAKVQKSETQEPKTQTADEPDPEDAPAAVKPSGPPIPTPQPVARGRESESGDDVIPAGPAIRRLAREVGVDLAQVTGTGDGGRITRDDVLAVVRQASRAIRSGGSASGGQGSSATTTSPAKSGQSSTDDATARDDHGPIRVERMTKIRKTIAAQMHKSWSTVARVTNFDDADVTDLEKLRQSSKDDYAAQGLKLTTMPFLIKAVATSLRHHPGINAVIDGENEQIIYKQYVNIGIAVDTEQGLVVPVLRDVDRMGIPEITRALAELAGKVRGGKFSPNELRGGTFTISNLGAIGGQYSTPVVNVPEVAILLVGRSRKLPVVMPDDSIQPRLMMPLSLSYDHRLVDGANAARFLNDVIGYLQAPSRLLLAL